MNALPSCLLVKCRRESPKYLQIKKHPGVLMGTSFYSNTNQLGSHKGYLIGCTQENNLRLPWAPLFFFVCVFSSLLQFFSL